MSFFEFLSEKDENTLTGNYYARRPKTTEDKCIEFAYDIDEDISRDNQNVLNSLQAEHSLYSIKTVANIKFAINGYVATQDGEFWQITSMLKRPYKAERTALRTWKNAPIIETVLRLAKVENPWGLK